MKAQLLVALLAFCNLASASDFGAAGLTLPIVEQDIREFFKERLAQLEKSGVIDKKRNEMKARALEYAKRPPGILLPTAATHTSKFFDPTITVANDIFDADGNVLMRAGERVNPFPIRPLKKGFCIINGDDEKQVKWLSEYCGDKKKYIAILINGPILELQKRLPFPVYFDQRQEWIKKFDLTAVPTVIRQSGSSFNVETFVP